MCERIVSYAVFLNLGFGCWTVAAVVMLRAVRPSVLLGAGADGTPRITMHGTRVPLLSGLPSYRMMAFGARKI